MRTYLIISIFLCLSFACRKGDTYPDYDEIVGKYKLIYIKEENISWPYDSTIRIYPSDKYEIEFKKMSKVMLLKNGKCEKKLKVYECKSSLVGYPNPYRTFTMKIDKKDCEFGLYYRSVTNSLSDTLRGRFYPFDIVNTNNGGTYVCYYTKE